MRTHLLLICLFCNLLQVIAQINPVSEYLKASKDYAVIYNGEIELGYNSNTYENFPYFQGPDFVPGEITFMHKTYPGQQIRLDLHKDQVIVTTPQGHLCMIVDTEEIDSIRLHNTTFIHHRSSADNKLESGFYQLLHNGKQFTLLARKKYAANKVPAERLIQVKASPTDYFTYNEKYYLKYNGEYYPIANQKSFGKLFPAYKKSINRHCKKQRLKFRKEAESSLISLTDYCEDLITPKQ